jgi:hypothetical protein
MLTLRSGEPYSNVIMGIQKTNGELTWISINTRPLFRPGEDKAYAVLSSFSDITGRMQLYQVLERRVEMRTREQMVNLNISTSQAAGFDEVVHRRAPLILSDLWGNDFWSQVAVEQANEPMRASIGYAPLPILGEGQG